MVSFTDSSHNVLYKLNADKWTEDLRKSSQADITGYQEAGADKVRRVITTFCNQNNRGLYFPRGNGNAISWKQETWKPVLIKSKPVMGIHRVHKSAIAMGLDAKLNPPRDFTWVGLEHIKSKQKVLRINVHPVASATDPTPEEGPKLDAYKNWAIGQYWLDVLAFTAEQMSVPALTENSMKNFWDAILLGGDYNGDFLNQPQDKWYYPNKLLPALYVADETKAGLDHLQHTHGSDVKVTKRWKVQGNTDHAIHFVTRDFEEKADFPG